MPTIAAPIDFLGINYYRRHIVRADERSGRPVVVDPPGAEYTGMGWEVYPPALYELLIHLRDEYEVPPLYITENGAAFTDNRDNGHVDDPQRTSYIPPRARPDAAPQLRQRRQSPPANAVPIRIEPRLRQRLRPPSTQRCTGPVERGK